jgi:hypothetical protein
MLTSAKGSGSDVFGSSIFINERADSIQLLKEKMCIVV